MLANDVAKRKEGAINSSLAHHASVLMQSVSMEKKERKEGK
jgi:hypothetical protein